MGALYNVENELLCFYALKSSLSRIIVYLEVFLCGFSMFYRIKVEKKPLSFTAMFHIVKFLSVYMFNHNSIIRWISKAK